MKIDKKDQNYLTNKKEYELYRRKLAFLWIKITLFNSKIVQFISLFQQTQYL